MLISEGDGHRRHLWSVLVQKAQMWVFARTEPRELTIQYSSVPRATGHGASYLRWPRDNRPVCAHPVPPTTRCQYRDVLVFIKCLPLKLTHVSSSYLYEVLMYCSKYANIMGDKSCRMCGSSKKCYEYVEK